MISSVQSIPVEFGNALFKVYKISVGNIGKHIPSVHSHKYYEIHFAINGKHVYQFNDSQVELTANQMLIIPPETIHTRIDDFDKNYNCSVLEFALEKTSNSPELYDNVKETLATKSLKPINFNTEIFDNLNRFKNLDQNYYCELKTSAYILINCLITSLSALKSKNNTQSKCDDLGVLMDTLINKGATLKEIALEINYTERHTARLINQRYGQTLTSLNKNRKQK